MKAEASWDSTIHECPQLSRGGAWPEHRVYLTVRVVVQLSHPADMQLVLRKRICVNVNPGRQGFAHNLLKRMSTRSTIPGCGVTFEVVSNIPGVRQHEVWKVKECKGHFGMYDVQYIEGYITGHAERAGEYLNMQCINASTASLLLTSGSSRKQPPSVRKSSVKQDGCDVVMF